MFIATRTLRVVDVPTIFTVGIVVIRAPARRAPLRLGGPRKIWAVSRCTTWLPKVRMVVVEPLVVVPVQVT